MMESPILFSGPMVRAILAGRKTQTRRVIKPHPPAVEVVYKKTGVTYGWMRCDDWKGKEDHFRVVGPVGVVRDLGGRAEIRCPFGKPGDRLWVRETFEILSFGGSCVHIRYAADDSTAVISDTRVPNRIGGVPSIHMPRNASRITLEVAGVRVERLQEITQNDAIAEGCEEIGECDPPSKTPREWFLCIWNMLNEKRGYPVSANPWVWVINFKMVESR